MNKRECYLFFAGYYMVSAASSVLCRNNIDTRIVRAPAYMQKSCSFAVLIDESDEKDCLRLLEKERIVILHREYREKRA